MNLDLSRALANALIKRGWTLALAESCTGGLVSATLTELPGSSAWFERAYITYSNEAKAQCLDVPLEAINSFGAVSEPVAIAMAQGARKKAAVHVAISITGIAGPAGGSPEKPVGTVCFAWVLGDIESIGLTHCKTAHFLGDRSSIRKQACEYALTELIGLLTSTP
jgi:nicotinamide-nucleotide amidase